MDGSGADLRATMAGIRALLLDIDGVIVLRGREVPGAAAALRRIEALGMPFRLATNTSALSRATLAAQLATIGIGVPPERILTAASAAASHVRRRHPGGRIFLISSADARVEFSGLDLIDAAAAADGTPEATADAVVIGDAADELTFRQLDRAFGHLRAGAEFVAMHKNRWWLTERGATLDSGGLVAGLEYAAERRARVVGKPAPAFFREAVAAMALETGSPALRAGEVAMVGDDIWNDVLGAQRAGLRGIFVRSGKHGDAELERAVRQRRGGGRADALAPDLAAVVAALPS